MLLTLSWKLAEFSFAIVVKSPFTVAWNKSTPSFCDESTFINFKGFVWKFTSCLIFFHFFFQRNHARNIPQYFGTFPTHRCLVYLQIVLRAQENFWIPKDNLKTEIKNSQKQDERRFTCQSFVVSMIISLLSNAKKKNFPQKSPSGPSTGNVSSVTNRIMWRHLVLSVERHRKLHKEPSSNTFLDELKLTSNIHRHWKCYKTNPFKSV